MTRSSRPSFPPQILLRQSRARSLALFSDLTSAPLVGGWWLVVGGWLLTSHQPPTTNHQHLFHSGDSSERLSQYCCSASLISERRTIFSKSTSSSGKGVSRKAAAC